MNLPCHAHDLGLAMTRTLLARPLQCLLLTLTLLCGNAVAQASVDCPPIAQPPSDEQLRAGLRDARDRGFLWRLRKGDHSSYLYGTVHVAQAHWAYPGPKLRQALNASDTIALELDVLDPDIQQRMTRAMRASADGPALPDALQQRVQRRADAECVPAEVLAALAPEMQVATLMSLVGRRDGFDPAWGIDVVLAGWARGAHKTVVSLETPEQQMHALQMGSADETNEFVASALDAMDSGRAAPTLRRIAQAWADADLDALAQYESWCDCMNTAADRAAMQRLLDDRNPALADAIDALHAGGKRVFAAVGSLHMAGRLGLPALLAQRGYRVERIEGAR